MVRNPLIYICLKCKTCFVFCSVWCCHVFKIWNTAVQVICSRPGVHLSSGNKAHMDFLSCHIIMLHYWGFNVIGWLMVWWDIFCSGSCNRVQADSESEEKKLYVRFLLLLLSSLGKRSQSELPLLLWNLHSPTGRNHQLTTGNSWCSSWRQPKQEVDG